MNVNGQETVTRGCEYSDNYNGETDRCVSADGWGKRHVECVCDTDNCNHGLKTICSKLILAFGTFITIMK